MGYGKNLKNILDEKGMTVKELAKKAGIAPTTLYSIIQRDTAIRFDTALKISNILDIPINSICKDNPYAPGQTLPELPSDKEIMMTSIYKKAYVSERTFDLLKNFDYTELNIVDKLIADFFVLYQRSCRFLRCGTGSNPPRHHGLQRSIRKTVKNMPRQKPWTLNASAL